VAADLRNAYPSLAWPSLLILTLMLVLRTDAQSVTTSQYDNARSGANQHETILTPRNVNVRHFGKIFTLKVDGNIYAQPLFLAGLEIPGKGRHDVLFIATEHDSVYAFDAYGHPAAPLWRMNFLSKGVTTVPEDDVECPFIAPEVGITSTPVIDADTGTLYVLARTRDTTRMSASHYRQRLHALSVTTGLEKLGGPVDIKATIEGKGTGSQMGKLPFDPLRENPRASLLLANGSLYLTWGSSADVGPYHGWAMAYDAHTLKQKAVFNASPDGDDSGFWASDTGPAADEQGHLFLAAGNGRFDAASGGRDYGDSLLKLNGQSLKLSEYFAPFNVAELNAKDGDLGSGGPVLLPPQTGPHRHLVVIAGKGGTIYLIDRDHMGHYQRGGDSQTVQTIPSPGGGVFGSMGYWNHSLYVLSDSAKDGLRQFTVKSGRLSLKAASGSRFPAVAATPTISANGLQDGVLWVLHSKAWNADDTNAVLFAFDALDTSRLLYVSEQNPFRDRAGLALRFNLPIVANGHVYVGAKHEVDVYGLLSREKARQ
jgi:hypothetical protein